MCTLCETVDDTECMGPLSVFEWACTATALFARLAHVDAFAVLRAGVTTPHLSLCVFALI